MERKSKTDVKVKMQRTRKTPTAISAPDPAPIVIISSPVAPVPSKARRTIYYIANPTAADVIYPRPGRGGLRATQIIFPAGKSTAVDAAEWAEIRKISGMRNYLDNGMLAEVGTEKDVLIVKEASADPPIPEHLKREGEEVHGKATEVKASVRQKTVTHINV